MWAVGSRASARQELVASLRDTGRGMAGMKLKLASKSVVMCSHHPDAARLGAAIGAPSSGRRTFLAAKAPLDPVLKMPEVCIRQRFRVRPGEPHFPSFGQVFHACGLHSCRAFARLQQGSAHGTSEAQVLPSSTFCWTTVGIQLQLPIGRYQHLHPRERPSSCTFPDSAWVGWPDVDDLALSLADMQGASSQSLWRDAANHYCGGVMENGISSPSPRELPGHGLGEPRRLR